MGTDACSLCVNGGDRCFEGEVWLATPEHVDEVLDYTSVTRETEGCDYDTPQPPPARGLTEPATILHLTSCRRTLLQRIEFAQAKLVQASDELDRDNV